MTTNSNPLVLMDHIYRYQRFFYDWTRKYYLLGRDALLREMNPTPGDHILEVGCGTGRNLIRLAQQHPQLFLYGLDASQAMLKTARAKVSRAKLNDRITLCHGLAEEMHPRTHFNLGIPFDSIFFSYSLSMIPTWKKALEQAMAGLKPQGKIYIADYWDQEKWPLRLRRLLQGWLKLFHVKHEPELIGYLSA
jgi:S-adenosylmethionine-diacylgycerolhomoserine-N-methlytransferase